MGFRRERRCRVDPAGWSGGLEALEPRQFLSADLSIGAFSVSPGSPWRQRQAIDVQVGIINSGDRGTGTFVIEGRLSSDRVWGNADDIVIRSERTQAGVEPGAVVFRTGLTVPRSLPRGRYYLGVGADSTNEVPESNEVNNTWWFDRRVRVLGSIRAVVSSKGRVIPSGYEAPSAQYNTDFGVTDVDGPGVSKTYRLRNTGTDPMRIESIRVTGETRSSFALIGSMPTEIAPGAGANIRVRFAPSFVGEQGAAMVIRSNDPTSPYRIQLKGRGTSSEIRSTVRIEAGTQIFNPPPSLESIDLGRVSQGADALTLQFRVFNTGNVLLSSPTVELTHFGPNEPFFLVTSPRAGVIRPGQFVQFTIGMKTNRLGRQGAELYLEIRRSSGETGVSFFAQLGGEVVQPAP